MLLFSAINFSHRIEKLSFGDQTPIVVNTLDGIEKITLSSIALLQLCQILFK